jgi:uncharacterized protein YcbX
MTGDARESTMSRVRDGETPRLSGIAVHPVKALDPVDLERVAITDIGGLDNDRAYAIVTEDGEYLNGKRTDAVHRIRSDVDLEAKRVSLGVAGGEETSDTESEGTGDVEGGETRAFHLDADREAIEAWLSEFFERPVRLEVGAGGSLTDGVIYGEADRTGPTLVSAATLREVASWYDGIDAREMRLRLRPNLVVEGVPPFWEDRLVAGGGREFRIGDVRLAGTHPIPRCVVPTRDPHTGEPYERFRETFIEQRAATLPEWVDREPLDGNLFSVTVGTRVPESERDGTLRVGDELQVV